MWSTLEAKITALVVQMEPIVCAQWRPFITISATDNTDINTERMLAYCTGTTRIYFWRSKVDNIGGEVSWSNTGNNGDSCNQTASTSFVASSISPQMQKQISKWLKSLQFCNSFACHHSYSSQLTPFPLLFPLNNVDFKVQYRFSGRKMGGRFFCAVKSLVQFALYHRLDLLPNQLCRCNTAY